MNQSTSIILAHKYSLIREGLRLLIKDEPTIKVVGTASSSEDVINILNAGIETDVILADMNISSIEGVKLATSLRSTHESIKILVLCNSVDLEQINEAFQAGVKGFLNSDVRTDELLFALKRVGAGQTYIAQDLMYDVTKYHQNGRSRPIPVLTAELSTREREVLQMVADGYTNQKIADTLFISKRTVEGHRLSLTNKTGTTNTPTLIKFAVANGLIK